MTDKEKIRAEVERLKAEQLAIFSKGENEDSCGDALTHIGAYNQLLSFIDFLPEEPVSEDFEDALTREWKSYNDRGAATVDALEDNTQELTFAKGFYQGAKWGKHQAEVEIQAQSMALAHGCPKESVGEDLGGYINELSKQFPEVSFAKLSRIAVRVAKWKEQQLMANAVEGVVHHFEKCKVASVHYNDPTGVPMAYFTSPEGLSAGDKVKINVIKED